MEKSKWNRMVSIPIQSLTQEELKEAIHEWAEGCDELEQLLWACYNNGIETCGCHVSDDGHYFSFYVDEVSENRAKRIVAATEATGFGHLLVHIGSNPMSGPNWYKTDLLVSCLKDEKAAEYFNQLTCAVEQENDEKFNCGFEYVVSMANFFEDKMLGVNLRAVVSNYTEYRLCIEAFMNQRNWTYLDELFGSLGMICERREDELLAVWRIEAGSKEEFCEAVKKLDVGIRSKWNLEVPTEPTDDMDFCCKALVMRKKFGTSMRGIKRMNKWLTDNSFSKSKRKVNY